MQSCVFESIPLPILLNGYLAYRTNLYYRRHAGSRWDSPSRPELGRIAPWQYALIQRIDLSLQQVSIEECLYNELQLWQPVLRHSGAYVSPRYYNTLNSYSSRKAPEVSAHNFALVPAPAGNAAKGIEDGNKVTLQRWDVETSDDPEYEEFGGKYRVISNFTAAAMVARKLTHLTLRMSRTDWWTWTNDPDTIDNDKQLALDPAHGGKKPRPLLHDMLALANARRAGQHPPYDEPCSETWGAVIGALPDLNTFELVLETFSPKKKQLEAVVECARTWKFPLKGTDGARRSEDEDVDDVDTSTGPIRGVGFHEQSEAHALGYRVPSTSNGYVESASSSSSSSSPRQRFMNRFLRRPRDETMPNSRPILPPRGPLPPEYSTETSASHSSQPEAEFFPDEPWLCTYTEFEVRIVPFRRKRVDKAHKYS